MNLRERCWYAAHPLGHLLLPLSWLFGALTWLRRWLYHRRLLRTERLPVPVIVVGNLTVGGTGKTPLVIWLCRHLAARGYRPGVVLRGYGGQARDWPQRVTSSSDPVAVGDEAVLLARRTGCPVSAGPERPAAARALLADGASDLIISDDGLQHYPLARDIEILVVDGQRRFGNGRLLPAGPLREPLSRVAAVDLIACNGPPNPGEHALHPQLEAARPLAPSGAAVGGAGAGQARRLSDFAPGPVHAVAGIGNPQRFFDALRAAGLAVIEHPLPDHHAFHAADLDFADPYPVLMTEKDGVKCLAFAQGHHWVVPLEFAPEAAFVRRLDALLERLPHGQKTAGNPGLSDLQGPAGVSQGGQRADLPGRPPGLPDP